MTKGSGRNRRVVAVAALMLAGFGAPAWAQTYDNPNLPRSPYALPAPTYHGQDEDDDFMGNTSEEQRTYSYAYRKHHGTGEVAKSLIGPGGLLRE